MSGAVVTFVLDQREERFGAPAILLCSKRIGFEGLLQRLVERTKFVEGRAPLVDRLSCFRRSDPFPDGIAQQPRTFGYLMQRQLVAEIHPANFAHHFHADHPVLSCSKIE